MPLIKAGEIPLRIAIQSKTVTYDAFNQPIEAWATTKTVWAGKLDDKGSEVRAAQRTVAETQAVFKVRYESGITVSNRIVHESRTYEILHVADDQGMHVALLLSCKEVV